MKWLANFDYFGAPIRLFAWLYMARKESRIVHRLRNARSSKGLESLTRMLRARAARKKTFFILGSGSSVCELGSARLEQIGAEISVGINVWAGHDFVPSVYALEPGRHPASVEELKHRGFITKRLERDQVVKDKPLIIELRPQSPFHPSQSVQIPAALQGNSHLFGRVNLLRSNSVRGLRLDIFLILVAIALRVAPNSVLPDNGATVVRLLFLAFFLGFKEIVLVGVDLNTNPYFWYVAGCSETYQELRSLFPRPLGKPHDTLETLNRPYDSRVFIIELSKVLEKHFGMKVWSGSKSSSLAGPLDVFRWEDEKSGP